MAMVVVLMALQIGLSMKTINKAATMMMIGSNKPSIPPNQSSSVITRYFRLCFSEYTFKSLANSYREKAVAIVLTGCDGDGREGVQVISQMGGKVIAQDRATSKVFSMPENALETGCVDLVLPIEEIADGIIRHKSQSVRDFQN